MSVDVKTRLLHNQHDPICYPDGSLYANADVSFQLVSAARKKAISLFDAESAELILGEEVVVQTNVAGEFQVELWPNTRGEFPSLYKVVVNSDVAKPFFILIPDGEASLSLLEARSNLQVATPQEVTAFQTLLASINDRLDQYMEPVTDIESGMMTPEQKIKLDGIEEGATHYIPPVSYSPTVIEQDATHRFVSDEEKTSWNGKEPALPAGQATQFIGGDKLLHALNKAAVGLGNVDNTADVNKPVSTAQAAAIEAAKQEAIDASSPQGSVVELEGRVTTLESDVDAAELELADHEGRIIAVEASDVLKAPLASPVFTGVPQAPTPLAGTNSLQIANTAFVAAALAAMVGSAPASLDTLNELATALGNDPNFSTTVLNAIAARAPIISPNLSGTPTAPTAPVDTQTQQIATTAFVLGQLATVAPLAAALVAAVGTSKKLAREDHVHPLMSAFAAGVTLGNVEQAGATTLDWYEEGTWTPTLRCSTTAGTYEFTATEATYTRWGRLVNVSAKLTLAAAITGGGSGFVQVGGLPFARAANALNSSIGPCNLSGMTFSGIPGVTCVSSVSTSLYISLIASATGMTYLQAAALVANAIITVNMFYRV